MIDGYLSDKSFDSMCRDRPCYFCTLLFSLFASVFFVLQFLCMVWIFFCNVPSLPFILFWLNGSAFATLMVGLSFFFAFVTNAFVFRFGWRNAKCKN